MDSIFEKETTYSVEYGALEEYIEEVYGHRIEIPASLEARNDSSYTVNVEKGKGWDWEKGEIDRWKETGEHEPTVNAIFQDLCDKDLIESGKYIINISW